MSNNLNYKHFKNIFMKISKMKYAIVLFAVLTFFSCKKENVENNNTNIKTVEQENSVNAKTKSNNELALLLAEIAIDKEVQKEVYEAVNLRYEGNYRIKVEYLLNPELIDSEKQKSTSIKNGKFKTQFLSVINKKFQKNGEDDSFDVIEYIKTNNIEIAWHYSQEWDSHEIPTITFNPIDNDSINIGYKPYFDSGDNLMLDTVLVDDNYAYEHPVWIIDEHEELSPEDPLNEKFAGQEIQNDNNKSALGFPDGSAKRNKIYIYRIKTDGKNFRALFGGENKVNFRRAGKEVVMGADKSYFVRVSIDRWAGRNGVWRTPNATWDEDWQPEEVEQWIGVEGVEVNKTTTTKYSGDISLKFEIKDGKIVPSATAKVFAWEVSVNWQNELWYGMDKSRVNFFYDNWIDANRLGTQDGRCIYMATSGEKRGTIFFTFDVDAIN